MERHQSIYQDLKQLKVSRSSEEIVEDILIEAKPTIICKMNTAHQSCEQYKFIYMMALVKNKENLQQAKLDYELSEVVLSEEISNLARVNCALAVNEQSWAFADFCFKESDSGRFSLVNEIEDIADVIHSTVNHLKVIAKLNKINRQRPCKDTWLAIYKEVFDIHPPECFTTAFLNHHESVKLMYLADLRFLITLAYFIVENHPFLSEDTLPKHYFSNNPEQLSQLQALIKTHAKYVMHEPISEEDVRLYRHQLQLVCISRFSRDELNVFKQQEQENNSGYANCSPKL